MNISYEQQYLAHLQSLLEAPQKMDRTGTSTRSIFGHQMKADLRHGFPLLTTKKVFTKGVIVELLWFLKGDTNIKYLNDHGVHIWDEWATKYGALGPIYGEQWRRWLGVDGIRGEKIFVDQIQKLVDGLKANPESRRQIVSAWNPAELPLSTMSPSENADHGYQALPPCHTLFQVNCQEIPLSERKQYWKEVTGATVVSCDESKPESVGEFLDSRQVPKYYIDLQLYQRSADWFLGVPFNVASYSLLLEMLGQICNMVPRYFIHSFGDTHLYSNHEEQAKEQLSRELLPMPTLSMNKNVSDIFQFKLEDFSFENYQHHAAIKAEVSV